MRPTLVLCIFALLGLVVFGTMQSLSTSDNSQAMAEVETLKAEIEAARADFEAENTDFVQQVSDLAASNASQAAALEAALAEKEQLTTDIDLLSQQLEAVTAQSTALTTENEELSKTLATLRQDMSNQGNSSGEDAATIAALNETVAQGVADREALAARAADLERQLADYQARIEVLESEVPANAVPPNDQIDALDTLVQERTAALEAANERLAALTERAVQQEALTDAMSGEITTLAAELENMSKALLERDETIATLRSVTTIPARSLAAQCQEQSDTLLEGTAISFESGTAVLTSESILILEAMADIASQCTQENLGLDIEGHTDNVGGVASNLLLSNSRAQVVYDFLSAAGIPVQSMRSVGFGGSAPIADNSTDAGQQQNQRIAFVWKQK